MLKSLILVTQSSIDTVDNKFGGGNCEEDKARILLVFFTSKKSTGAGFLTPSAKMAFNLL